MQFKSVTAAAFAALLATTHLAGAQDALVEIENDDVVVSQLNLTVDDIEDMNVVDASGETIGEVEEVLGSTPDGEPMALSIEVGGFLGIGSRDAIVMLDQVTLVDGEIVLDMTREQIEGLPVWED
jgi:sporulation protein YlmC with PRC-barrel domain